jgi:hypothetical protein
MRDGREGLDVEWSIFGQVQRRGVVSFPSEEGKGTDGWRRRGGGEGEGEEGEEEEEKETTTTTTTKRTEEEDIFQSARTSQSVRRGGPSRHGPPGEGRSALVSSVNHGRHAGSMGQHEPRSAAVFSLRPVCPLAQPAMPAILYCPLSAQHCVRREQGELRVRQQPPSAIKSRVRPYRSRPSLSLLDPSPLSFIESLEARGGHANRDRRLRALAYLPR